MRLLATAFGLLLGSAHLLVAANAYASGEIADAWMSDHVEPSLADGFDGWGQAILLSGVLTTVVARQYDHKVRRAYRNHQKISRDGTKFGAVWGSGLPGAGIALVQWGVDREAGIAHGEAMAFASLSHISLVLLARRERPGSATEWNSFPSGHSTSAFATATALSYSYGPLAAATLYPLAAFTAMARVSDDRHWFSDVVAAAFIGIYWGRATSFHHEKSAFTLTPHFENGVAGVRSRYAF